MDIAREQTKFTNICRLECTNSRTHLCSILVHVQDDILMGTWRHRCIGALFLFKPLGTLWLGQVAWLSLKISYTKLGPVTQILWGLKAHSRVSLMSFQMFERDSRHRNRGTTQRPDRRHGHFWRFQSSRVPGFQWFAVCSLWFSGRGKDFQWTEVFHHLERVQADQIPTLLHHEAFGVVGSHHLVKVARWSEGARWRCRTYLTHLDGTWWNLDETYSANSHSGWCC